jgi:dihydrofolate reductase
MPDVIYALGVSLDGYIVGPDGRFDWNAPGEELFRFAMEEVRVLGAHLLGRRLYETMRYWDSIDDVPDAGPLELEFAELWQALPKVVFSRTLSSVDSPNTRLAESGLAEEVARLRAEPVAGDIAIGGATLAAEAAALDLIDEYRVRVQPVLVGGGTPFFAREGRRVDLELVDTGRVGPIVVHLRYRVVR